MHHVLDRPERESPVTSSRRWHGVRRTNKGKFRAVSDSLCCGTVHLTLTLTHTHQGTQGARYVAEVRKTDSSSHISRARSSSSKWLNKLRKGHHTLLSPSIDDSSDTLSDISDFRWWTSILTRQCVTCLNLKYPLMFLQCRQEHVLENAEGTACDGNQPSKRDVALLSRSDCSTGVLDKNLDGLETTITSRQP